TSCEGRFPYSWADKIHVVTRESYIRNELLFKPGDSVTTESIEEAERELRRRPIFRYVKITPLPIVDGTADVVVETDDTWTTSLQVGFGVAGGHKLYDLGILENNFLGQGKAVGAFIRKDIDRTVEGVTYQDRQFVGSRWDLFTGYGRDEKGRDFAIG